MAEQKINVTNNGWEKWIRFQLKDQINGVVVEQNDGLVTFGLGDWKNLTIDLSPLEAEITAIKSRLTALENRMTAAESTISNHETRISALEA